MMRCLLVDDERLVRERLRSLLAAHADVQVAGERGDGLSALDAVQEFTPDVVFLDIQMPGLTGLEVAEAWKRDGTLPIVIFVTAYDQFAVEAFRLHALDYLTKPIDPERFAEALDRARRLLAAPNRDDPDRRIQAMLEAHERRKASRPHIVVRDKDGYVLVPTREIHCLEATGNYVQVHCANSRHLVRSTLSALEAKLDPERFLRTHRSWIVNLDYVREAQPWSKGSWSSSHAAASRSLSGTSTATRSRRSSADRRFRAGRWREACEKRRQRRFRRSRSPATRASFLARAQRFTCDSRLNASCRVAYSSV